MACGVDRLCFRLILIRRNTVLRNPSTFSRSPWSAECRYLSVPSLAARCSFFCPTSCSYSNPTWHAPHFCCSASLSCGRKGSRACGFCAMPGCRRPNPQEPHDDRRAPRRDKCHGAFRRDCRADNMTLNVARGSIQAVIGPNGAGKSTLLNVITGLSSAAEGTVSFEGKEDRKPRAACADPNGHRTDFSKHRTIRRDERSRNVMIGLDRHHSYGIFSGMSHSRRYRQSETSARQQAQRFFEPCRHR